MTPAKGIHVLCEGFRMLEADAPDLHELVVAGGMGKQGRKLWDDEMRKFSGAGLSDCISHVGTLDLSAKAEFLKSLSVFSVPSCQTERQAVSTIEALAAGCPVVTTNHGIYPELISLSGGGILVEPNNPRALAGALTELRNDRSRREEMGKCAAEGSEQHFSDKMLTDRTLALYEKLLDSGDFSSE